MNVGLSLAAEAGPAGESVLELPLVCDLVLHSELQLDTLPPTHISVPLPDSSPQVVPPPPPVVDVEGQDCGVLGEDPGLPDLGVVLGDDQRDGDGQPQHRHHQPDQGGQGRLLQEEMGLVNDMKYF